MKNVFIRVKPFVPALLLFILFGSTAWQDQPAKPADEKKHVTIIADTTKPRQYGTGEAEPGMTELDEALKKVDEAMRQLSQEMKKLDFRKLEIDNKASLSKVEMEKMQAEIKAVMEKTDWQKMRKEIEQSVRAANGNLKELDLSSMEQGIARMREDLEKQQMDHRLNMERIRENVAIQMQKARIQLEKTRDEMIKLQAFTGELEKDGLIDKRKGYKVQVKDGSLYINGVKQPDATYKKYQKHYRKDNFTINNNGENIISL